MSDLNKVMLIGRLTRDPESHSFESGNSVVNFGIATNRSWKDSNGTKKEEVEFTDVSVWGKLGEICGQYLTKGRQVYIEGRLQTREWYKDDGTKGRHTEVVASEVLFLGNKADGGEAPAATNSKPSDEIKTDEIPF